MTTKDSNIRTRRLSKEELQTREPMPVHTWVTRVGSAGDPVAPPAIFELDDDTPLLIGREMDPPLDDEWLSARHAEIRRDESGWVLKDLGSSNGTLYWGQRQSSAVLSDGDLFETGGTFWRFRSMPLSSPLPGPPYEGLLATLDPEFQSTVKRLRRVSRTRVPMMLLGSTGCGKEVLARQIHETSGRTGKFVAINTAAIQRNLIAAELFGVEKGAHSTADRARQGKVRAADGGTLLLDEIGDMPLEVQAALLRMLQESEVVPVGGEVPVPIDVRILCATHQDLESMVAAGTFRADLFGRLDGCRIQLPDLADRAEDIGLLIGRFLERYGAADLTFQPTAYRALLTYPWPLNVRELEKAIETAVALVTDDRIERKDLPGAVIAHQTDRPSLSAPAGSDLEAEYERELPRLLEVHAGNVSAVARSMGRSRMQIHRWLKRLGLDPESFRS